MRDRWQAIETTSPIKSMTREKRQKVLLLIPLGIITGLLIYSWTTFLLTDTMQVGDIIWHLDFLLYWFIYISIVLSRQL